MEKKYYRVHISFIKPADKEWHEPEHKTGGWAFTEASSEEEAMENLKKYGKRKYLREFKVFRAELVTDFVPEFLING